MLISREPSGVISMIDCCFHPLMETEYNRPPPIKGHPLSVEKWRQGSNIKS